MLLVDSHCHLDQLDLTQYQGSLDAMFDAAFAQQVGYFLCVCIDMENYPAVLDIAKRYPFVSASVGVHPNVQTENELTTEALLTLAREKEVVAIGETGLDYYRSEGDLAWQHQRFIRHIEVAKQTKKPLIVHTRNAGDDTIQLLKEHQADQVGGVLHCFTDEWRIAKAALDLNFSISFSGIVTFKNAKDLQQTACKVPLEKLLIETDAPYLAPTPYRGKPNQPAYVRYVAEAIASLRHLPVETVAKASTDNFFRLFSQANRQGANA